MSGERAGAKLATGSKRAPRLSFDAAFVGGSLAIGAMLFILLIVIKDFFPVIR